MREWFRVYPCVARPVHPNVNTFQHKKCGLSFSGVKGLKSERANGVVPMLFTAKSENARGYCRLHMVNLVLGCRRHTSVARPMPSTSTDFPFTVTTHFSSLL